MRARETAGRVAMAIATLIVLTPPAPAAEPGPAPVTIETAVQVPMRDGVALAADVYRPRTEGRFPVLLQRTPYDRRDPVTGLLLASHGYVVVLQDTRGRYDSGGEFYPFRHEAADGYDTVEWAAALPYANGKVGMFGAGPQRLRASLSGLVRARMALLPGRGSLDGGNS